MRFFQSLIIIAAVVFCTACASGPVTIAPDLSPAELIQRGQEASDRSRYNQSLQYYEAILDRYPSNIDAVCAAEYEIAFIHYKQKKYEQSKTEFDALMTRYNGVDAELLPPEFKVLAVIVLEKIPEKTK
jgi:outer membrane protein assembly factor BamD (BamD/ComL family)